MPLAFITSDSLWFAIDVYEKRPVGFVKIFTKGPFKATPDAAKEELEETVKNNLSREVVMHRFDQGEQRWVKWP